MGDDDDDDDDDDCNGEKRSESLKFHESFWPYSTAIIRNTSPVWLYK